MYHNYTYLGSRGLITTIISSINIALWDIKDKTLGKPIYDLLSGPVRDNILLYTQPKRETPGEAAKSARELVAQGCTALQTDPFTAEMGSYHTA